MTADQLGLATMLLNVLEKVSTLPFGVLLILVVIGPWILSLALAWLYNKRFEAVIRMYENNVELCKDYDAINKDLHDVVIMNTSAMTRLVDSINVNQFCPMVRFEKQAKGVQ